MISCEATAEGVSRPESAIIIIDFRIVSESTPSWRSKGTSLRRVFLEIVCCERMALASDSYPCQSSCATPHNIGLTSCTNTKLLLLAISTVGDEGTKCKD